VWLVQNFFKVKFVVSFCYLSVISDICKPCFGRGKQGRIQDLWLRGAWVCEGSGDLRGSRTEPLKGTEALQNKNCDTFLVLCDLVLSTIKQHIYAKPVKWSVRLFLDNITLMFLLNFQVEVIINMLISAAKLTTSLLLGR
jgi:hypothetical protein